MKTPCGDPCFDKEILADGTTLYVLGKGEYTSDSRYEAEVHVKDDGDFMGCIAQSARTGRWAAGWNMIEDQEDKYKYPTRGAAIAVLLALRNLALAQ